jgi:hypothetical protein
MLYMLLAASARHIVIDCVFPQVNTYVYVTGAIRRRPADTYARAGYGSGVAARTARISPIW